MSKKTGSRPTGTTNQPTEIVETATQPAPMSASLSLESVTEIDLSKVIVDGGTQVRAKLDQETIENYRAILTENEQCVFPPIIVYKLEGKETLLLAAGFHRVAAARSEGWKTFPGIIRVGTYREALLEAIESNARHGLPYSNHDKRRAVVTLLGDEEWVKFSDGEIARRVAVSQPFVSKLRAELSHNGYEMPTERVVERGGKQFTQNTANIGKASSKPVSDVVDGDFPEDVAPEGIEVGASKSFQGVVETISQLPKDQLRDVLVELLKLFPDLFPRTPKVLKPVKAPPPAELGTWLQQNYSKADIQKAMEQFGFQNPSVPSLKESVQAKLRKR